MKIFSKMLVYCYYFVLIYFYWFVFNNWFEIIDFFFLWHSDLVWCVKHLNAQNWVEDLDLTLFLPIFVFFYFVLNWRYIFVKIGYSSIFLGLVWFSFVFFVLSLVFFVLADVFLEILFYIFLGNN